MCQNHYPESSFLGEHKLTGTKANPCELDRGVPPPSHVDWEPAETILGHKIHKGTHIHGTGKGKALGNPWREGGVV